MSPSRLKSILALSLLASILEAQAKNPATPGAEPPTAAKLDTDAASFFQSFSDLFWQGQLSKAAASSFNTAPGQAAPVTAEDVSEAAAQVFGLHPQDKAAASAARAPEANQDCDCPACAAGIKVVKMDLPITGDIADAAGMNAPGFDVSSPVGRVIGLLAAARTQLEALAETAPDSLTQIHLSGSSINAQAAINMLQLANTGASKAPATS